MQLRFVDAAQAAALTKPGSTGIEARRAGTSRKKAGTTNTTTYQWKENTMRKVLFAGISAISLAVA
ncbi:MAG TPA: hypothetical protein VEJ16_05635, partial [Alphaproteobacteria bacterium]|nr:hypothetical protein [Alphaproteobacteria bacterium]